MKAKTINSNTWTLGVHLVCGCGNEILFKWLTVNRRCVHQNFNHKDEWTFWVISVNMAFYMKCIKKWCKIKNEDQFFPHTRLWKIVSHSSNFIYPIQIFVNYSIFFLKNFWCGPPLLVWITSSSFIYIEHEMHATKTFITTHTDPFTHTNTFDYVEKSLFCSLSLSLPPSLSSIPFWSCWVRDHLLPHTIATNLFQFSGETTWRWMWI